MKFQNCVSIWVLCILYYCTPTNCTITVTATPYEALPFPEGFKCQEKGVFPHKVHCEKYWLCQLNETGDNFKPAELYHCPVGYLFDRKIQFCNQAEHVTCSTLSKEKLAKALDIMKETQKLELRLKEIEDTLKDVSGNTQEPEGSGSDEGTEGSGSNGTLESASSNSELDNFVASNPDSLISLIF